MRSVGFPISHKEKENRRALIPADLIHIKHSSKLYFEEGYGAVLGYSDEDYLRYGANVVSRDIVLSKDVICDPKIGDADYLEVLNDQIIFGWVHAVQNVDITDKILASRLTVYAWEDMFESGRHVFWRNNEIAGEAAIMHAFEKIGLMPYNAKVALLGRGNVASGALKILTLLGADVTTYNRATESLLREELPRYDVLVNAILWDTSRSDHIIYKEDLARMKKNSLIIDISCDKNGGIETSIPTTIENPTYIVDGITHYVVDHTPALFFKTASIGISNACCKYMDMLINDTPNNVLTNAKCVESGNILDQRIIDFQKR